MAEEKKDLEDINADGQQSDKSVDSNAPRKKLTLSLKKVVSESVKGDETPISDAVKESVSDANKPQRASIFVVPAKPVRTFGSDAGFRDRRPMTPEERQRRMQFLSSNKGATSNAQPFERSRAGFSHGSGGRLTALELQNRDAFNNRNTKKKKVEYGSANKTNRFQDDNGKINLNIGVGVVENFSADFNAVEEGGWRKARGVSKRGYGGLAAPSVVRTVDVYDGILVQDLAVAMSISVRDLSRKLKTLSLPTAATTTFDIDTAEFIVLECGHKSKRVNILNVDDDPVQDYEGDKKKRAPIVTIVGHVDHGKTSLLDAIRQANVTAGEAGGITQHIGAYQVKSSSGELITFLDTPGHATFTSMRARGVQLTDIAVLVVAADDGIQEQTIEAIKHIQNAGVQFIVAVTKVDKPDANPQKVIDMLLHYNIVTEKHSGDVLAVEVSAHQKKGIKELLDAINLQADMMDLQSREDGHAIGVALETSVRKGFGNVANLIVQKGTLRVGDSFVVGSTYGKVRCLIDSNDQHVKTAGPSMPVAVVGINDICMPADRLVVVQNESMARQTAQARLDKSSKVEVKAKTLEELYAQDNEGKVLNLLLKADTAGSVEALKFGIEQLKNDEVKIKILYHSAGPVTETDIAFADVSKAIIVSFHNKVPSTMMKLAAEKFIHIISDDIIYKILENLNDLLTGMQTPVVKEEEIGKAEIIKLFSFSRGTVAGSKVLDGKMVRGEHLRVLRKGEVIADGMLRSMQKDMQDAKEALKGQECGIMMPDFHNYQLGDILVCYKIVE